MLSRFGKVLASRGVLGGLRGHLLLPGTGLEASCRHVWGFSSPVRLSCFILDAIFGYLGPPWSHIGLSRAL
eukprot:4106000-Pyramimonas_sp.AAC.1